MSWPPVLTNNPDEWEDVSHIFGHPTWQSNKNPNAWSEDGGKTYYLATELAEKEGSTSTYETTTVEIKSLSRD